MDYTSISHFTGISDFTTFQNSTIPISTVAEERSIKSFKITQIREWVRLISSPLLFFLGTFGNVMTIVIVARLRANRSSLDYYFLSLAVSDTCMLFAGPFRLWLNNQWDVDIRAFNTFTCKLTLFLFNAAGGASTWILVAMVVQRALSVVWPHRVGLICTTKRMWGIIGAIVVFFCLVYSHFWYGRIKKGSRCTYIPSYFNFLATIFVKIDVFLFSIIPIVGLMIGNAVLVTKLRVSVKEAGEQFAASDKQQSQREQTVNSITLTALAMSVSFIIFTFPIALWNTLSYVSPVFRENRSVERRAFDAFVQVVLYTIFYCNYTVNFYLYCLTGKRFRNEFKRNVSELVNCFRCSRT